MLTEKAGPRSALPAVPERITERLLFLRENSKHAVALTCYLTQTISVV